MFVKIGRGLNPACSPFPMIDMGSKTAVVFGDSISSANVQISGGTQKTAESVGYLTCYNALSKNRMYFPYAHNLGVSGDSTANMVARKTDLSELTFDVCFVMGGTNDIVAKVLASTVINNLANLYDYIANTLGKTVIALSILPRSSWASLTAPEIIAAKADIHAVNAWIASQHGSRGGKVIAVDLYTNFTNGSDEPLANATYDGIHPSPYGGMLNGRDIYMQLMPFFGNYNDPSFTTGNLLINGTLTGTGGTISSNFSGSVANNFTAVGFGGTNGRTASKNADGSQRLVMAVTGGTSSDSCRLTQSITSGFTVGDTVYARTLVQIAGTPAYIYGNALQLRLTGTGVPTLVNCFGLDRRNNDNWLPETYINLSPGKYLIETPDLSLSSGSGMTLEWRYEMLGNSTAGATSGTVDIFGAGIFKR